MLIRFQGIRSRTAADTSSLNLYLSAMKKLTCSLMLLLILAQLSLAQPDAKIDSVCSKICKSLLVSKDRGDSIRIREAFFTHLSSFIIQNKIQRSQFDSIFQIIDLRLQRNCFQYKEMLNRQSPTKGDWKEVSERPPVNLTKKNCTDFLKIRHYQYLEHNGDTVNLEIDNGSWIDRFADGTWSKLKFSRIDACEIEIEFIESNNPVRRNYSRTGDRYRYQILDKGDNYYLLLAESVGSDRLSTFKMYFKSTH